MLILPALLLGAVGLFLGFRAAEKLLLLAQLRGLQPNDVQSVSFGNRLIENEEAAGAVVAALAAVTWATTEHSCQAPGVPVTLVLKAGSLRQVWLASNPCANGVAVNLSDRSGGGLYHGALFSPTSSSALAAHGLALPSR
jgi:hypothetical protein